jgi:hypothetical protein
LSGEDTSRDLVTPTDERVLPVLDRVRAACPVHLVSVQSDRDLPADASPWGSVVRPRDGCVNPDWPHRAHLIWPHL